MFFLEYSPIPFTSLAQIDEEHIEPVPPTEKEIISDGVIAIIAGSDTTSTTLSGLFYYLMSNPVEYKRLQNEIDAAFPPEEGDPFDATKLAEMPFLNAVMYVWPPPRPLNLLIFSQQRNLALATTRPDIYSAFAGKRKRRKVGW